MNCLECGEEFRPFRPHQKFCSPQCCRRYHNQKQHVPKVETELSEKETSTPSDKTLADWIREAAECNLDYGTYRSLISAGKTFDELKKTFGRQVLQAHSKGSAHNHFTGGNII